MYAVVVYSGCVTYFADTPLVYMLHEGVQYDAPTVASVMVVVAPSVTVVGLAVSVITSGAMLILIDFDSAIPSALTQRTENVVGMMSGSVV